MITCNIFSAAGRRQMIPVQVADGSTIDQAIAAAAESVPADCEVHMDGEIVSVTTVLRESVSALRNVTINRKTKGNLV
jgi:hypothetical protein